MFDAGAHVFEAEWIFVINARGVPDGDTNLPHAAETFHDQRLMALMERLISTNKQSRRLLRIKNWPNASCNLFGPIIHSILNRYPEIKTVRRREQPIGIFKPTHLDPVDPNNEGIAALHEGCSGFWCPADKISDGKAACLDDLVAQPTHPYRMFDSVRFGKSKVLVNVVTNLIGVEVDGI